MTDQQKAVFEYLTQDVTHKELSDKYSFYFSGVWHRTGVIVEYDHEHFIDVLQLDYIGLNAMEFTKKYKITQQKYNEYYMPVRIPIQKITAMLRIMDIPYLVKITDKKDPEATPKYLTVSLKPSGRKRRPYKLRKPKRRPTTLSEEEHASFLKHYRVIEAQKEHAIQLLKERGMGTPMISRFEQRFDAVIRIALLAGVQMQKENYGDIVIQKILEEVY